MSNSQVKIFLQIEKQGTGYSVSATYKKEKCSRAKKFDKTLHLDTVGSSDNLLVKGYRCYGHKLNSYFQDNIKSIKEENFENRSYSAINLRSHSDDLKDVEVKLKVAICKMKINIYDKNDRILTNLLYTGEEYSQNRNLYVYFYNPDDLDVDTLPLLFQYKDTFYAPESRETYFEKWKEVTELTGVITNQVNIESTEQSQESKMEKDRKMEKIKNKLDTIFKMLHEVDLLKRTEYGIRYCSKEFLNRGDFNTKRFEVKISKSNKYQKVIHTSVRKYVIGSIKPVKKYKFEQHDNNKPKKDPINEVIAYFHDKDNRPELILLNEMGSFGNSFTHGYYEKQGEVYVYKPLEYPMNLELPRSSDDDLDYEPPVIDILENIKEENLMDDHIPLQSDSYTEECQKKYDEDSEDDECRSQDKDISGDSSSSNLMSTGTFQPATVDSQHMNQVTVSNGITHNQEPGRDVLQNEVSDTQTERSQSQEENLIADESDQMEDTSVAERGGSRRTIVEVAVEDPDHSNTEDSMNHRNGSMGQNLISKEQVHTSENEVDTGNQDGRGNSDQGSDVRNGVAEQLPGQLPKTPCTGEGKGTIKYVETGLKGFDDAINGAINYAKDNPGTVSGAGAGSLLSCAGGGYGVYKLVLRFI